METDLFSAAAYGEYATIDDRLKLVSDPLFVVNRQDEFGLTMLMEAARNNRIETVDYLLQHGANPNLVDHNQCSALHYACSDAHSDIIHMLIDHNADVNCRDSRGRTPIYYAEEKNRDDVIRILIYHGARLDIVDSEGKLPMQWMNDLRN